MKIQHSKNLIKCLLISTLLLSGCRKPESEFKLQKYEYAAGEAMVFENLSVHSKSSKWTIFNSQGDTTQTFEGKNPVIVIGVTAPNGAYTLRLTNYTKKERKNSYIEHPFLVKTVTGTLIINPNNSSSQQKEYDVYVDNQYIGKAGYAGAFQTKLPVGMRLVKLVSPTKQLEGMYTIVKNDSEYIYF